MQKRGFTLVELLVAIAVIGILAVLALAMVQSIHVQSQRTVCLSNLRQWGMALNLYANDNNGAYPRRGQGVQQVQILDRPEDWFNCLPPYLGLPSYQEFAALGRRIKPDDHSVFACPAAKDPGGGNFLPYAMNIYLSPWSRPNPHYRQEIGDPSQLAFLADAPGGWASTIPSTLPLSVVARHGGNANICFVDGHVASLDGDYVGCNKGEPARSDIRWQTLTDGINLAPLP